MFDRYITQIALLQRRPSGPPLMGFSSNRITARIRAPAVGEGPNGFADDISPRTARVIDPFQRSSAGSRPWPRACGLRMVWLRGRGLWWSQILPRLIPRTGLQSRRKGPGYRPGCNNPRRASGCCCAKLVGIVDTSSKSFNVSGSTYTCIALRASPRSGICLHPRCSFRRIPLRRIFPVQPQKRRSCGDSIH